MSITKIAGTGAETALYINPTLYEGRPDDFDSRLPKEQRVYTLLDSLGVSYSRLDHDATESIDSCHAVEQLLGIHICKNLLLAMPRKRCFSC